MDMKHRRPIPHYCDDRKLLVSRAKHGERLADDPPGLARLQGAEFIDIRGAITQKGMDAVEEIKRLAVEFGTKSQRFPVDV